MKTNEFKRIDLLEQITAGSNCSCIFSGGDLSYSKCADTVMYCKIACCGPKSLHVPFYEWDGKRYNCFENEEDFRGFSFLLESLKKSGLFNDKWERI